MLNWGLGFKISPSIKPRNFLTLKYSHGGILEMMGISNIWQVWNL